VQGFSINAFEFGLPNLSHRAHLDLSLIVITVNSTQSPQDPSPKHVAIIMDGNGRWAKERGLPRIEGHRRGAEAVKRTLKAAQENGVEIITLYAFSVENWNRPKDEVDALMSLLDRFLADQLPELIKRKIRLRVVGRYKELPAHIQNRLYKAEEATAHFTEHTLALALNYGARTEVIDAVKAVAQAAQAGVIDPNELDYDNFRNYLYTRDLPDPDLVIRTSGEARLSNFLLLQAAYAEIYFTPVLWPDFDESHFKAALADYASRERRYGQTAEQLQGS
jgi:undecaprenyl diphosphate synthase